MLRATRWLALSLGTLVLLGSVIAVGAGLAQAAVAADSGAVLADGGHVLATDTDRRAFDLLAVRVLRIPAASHASHAWSGRRIVVPKSWRPTGALDHGGKRWDRIADSGAAGKRWA